MSLGKVLLIIYSISTVIYLIWSYFDKTLGTYALWEIPIGGYIVFFWIIFIMGVLDIFPKTKDNM